MRLRISLLLTLVLTLTGCSSQSPENVEGQAVMTESGRVVPQRNSAGTLRWLDIPYAQPPIGELRWRAPQPLVARADTLARQDESIMCTQPASETSGVMDRPFVGQEDCLYLDIVAPAEHGDAPLPVMFWIHGGGNTTGRKGTYDFSALAARESVIVVTLNYRLGPFGWFVHPALERNSDGIEASSNYGTLDLIAGLNWVKRNIANFGGDPRNVTIFGESAGGRNVLTLLASPATEGLFHRAIVQSGHARSLSPEQAYNPERVFPQVDRGAWEVVRSLGLENTRVTAEQLRNVDAMALAEAYFGLEEDHIQPAIIADGIVVPSEGLSAALKNPKLAKNIPVLIGSNRDEVSLWLGLNRYFVDGSYPLGRWLPPKIRIKDEALYAYWIDVRARAWKARGVDLPLQALSSAGYTSLYAYRFDWDEQDDNWFLPFSTLFGAAHASEIAFIMGAPFYGSIGDFMYPDTASARAMTDTMMQSWASFARTGVPSGLSIGAWPGWSPDSPDFVVLDDGQQKTRRERGVESIPELLESVSASALLTDNERCTLAWEVATAVGQPDYDIYNDWEEGGCASVDVRVLKQRIRRELQAQFGSAELP